MHKIHYGILGCGKHALHSHALPARNDRYLELAALCDPSQDAMDTFLVDYSEGFDWWNGRVVPKKYSSEGEFFESNIDAVLIGSPDEFHTDALGRAVAVGKHVFCEKPLACCEKQLWQLPAILETARENRLVVSSCHPRRTDPPFKYMKTRLNDFRAEYGEILSFDFDFSYHEPSKAWKEGRGLLLDHANHEIDLLHFLFGYSNFEARRMADSYDHYHVVGKRRDGLVFSFSGTRRLSGRIYDEFMSFRFERARVDINAGTGEITIREHENRTMKYSLIPATDYKLRFSRIMDNFGSSIIGEDANYLEHKDLFVNNAFAVKLTENDFWHFSFNIFD